LNNVNGIPRFRFQARLLFLSSLSVLAGLLGCGKPSDFSSLEEAEALGRLQEVLQFELDPATLLKHGIHENGNSEFWVVFSPQPPRVKVPDRRVEPTSCPSAAIYSFAFAQGLSGGELEPPDALVDGRLWEWTRKDNDEGIRFRTAPLKKGYLSVIERLPEQ
jgi:hypothetical protein